MKYLLDVNALIACSVVEHRFHREVMNWIKAADFPGLLTCSITELGFVRVLAQVPAYSFTVESARLLLARTLRGQRPSWGFLADTLGAAHLSSWVQSPKQLTDGHLVALADSVGATLATLDRGIPGAYRIA